MNKQTLIDCRQTIKPFIHRTPVMTSRSLNEISGIDLFFKCENFQKGGAFKMRGGTFAVRSLSEENRKKGVVTHSSGNFAQAVALSAKAAGIPAYIVMPSTAPSVKVAAVKGYGAEVYICEPTLQAREAKTHEIHLKTGAVKLHPSNQLEVILGQATVSMELLEDHPDLDVIAVPVGGGGLLAGTALSVNFFGENCKTIAGEPMKADDAFRSLKTGKIEKNESADTVADGLRTTLGDINFPIIQRYVDEIIRVEESEIINAMRLIWERMKIIIEPSSAVPFAAILKEKEKFKGQKIGIIISGGNVDLEKLPF